MVTVVQSAGVNIDSPADLQVKVTHNKYNLQRLLLIVISPGNGYIGVQPAEVIVDSPAALQVMVTQ